MKRIKYSKQLYQLVKRHLGVCPICPIVQSDEKIKNKVAKCSVFRTSNTSITMQCSRCRLHNTITWKSLAEAIGRNADLIANQEEKEVEYAYYAKAFEILEKNVDITGIVRPTPKQVLLKRLLSEKLN